jgi:hypothetical protein
MPAAATVNLHSPTVPARAVLRILALWGLAAVSSLQPFNALGPTSFVTSSALFPDASRPESLAAVPPVEPQAGLSQIKGCLLGRFRVTFYWLVEEDDYPGERTRPLYNLRGELLGYFPARFVRDFRMESCAVLHDGRMLSDLRAGNRCRVVDAPIGCEDGALCALRSVAVDPSVVPLGAKLYVPEADGVLLEGDTRHDGLFCAQDVGGLIRGKRIDIYLGTKSNMEPFESTSLCRSGCTEVYIMP